LGFEPIPLDDEIADSVYCRDFLEHIPKAYYSESEKRLRYPIIELMNEVWRILKSGGSFTSLTPCYPNPEVHRDPTHLSVWTLESMQYFCGKYPVAKVYGIKTRFELVENRLDGFYLHAVLRKP
jgi:SAM-dependent methyltransferase